MAFLQSFTQFDINAVNLYWYSYYNDGSGLQDNTYINFNGQVYEDLFYVDGYDGADWLELVFLGSGISQDLTSAVTAGTVNVVGEIDLFTDSLLWYVEGISTSAVSIYNAALTPSNQDEIAIIQTALAGNDTIVLSPFDDRMYGFDGDDDIFGNGGNDTLDGGNGDDNLTGGSGNDTLNGGAGFDLAWYDDAIAGVTVNLTTGIGRSTVSDAAVVGIDNLISIEGVTGSNYADVITGNSSSNWLDGNGGDDWISGGDGADSLLGWDGNDQLFGEAGNDELYGENGDDILTGGSGSDFLNGGAGNDTFQDTKAGLNGDTITDFGIGDRIVITDASLAGFTFSLTGNTLAYTGGALTLTSAVGGTIVASAAAGGGVQLAVVQIPDVANDINGDGRSDVIWRSSTGELTNWLGQSDGGFASNATFGYASVPVSWEIAGMGDFNGDGRDDILWRNSDGQMTNWLGTATGGYTDNSANGYAFVSTSWHIAGTGDFNGDGRDDIVWRNDNGQMTNWLGTASGGYSDNSPIASTSIGTAWKIAGVGDFNGDGRDDILWRNDDGSLTNWLGQTNGSHANNPSASTSVSTSWHIAGTGDFNGDGRDDILWRNDNGDMTNWLGQANGAFVNNPNASVWVPTSWHIAAVGDYNGDGRDDILWRNDAGDFTNWLGQASGGFLNNANASTWVPINWEVQPDNLF